MTACAALVSLCRTRQTTLRSAHQQLPLCGPVQAVTCSMTATHICVLCSDARGVNTRTPEAHVQPAADAVQHALAAAHQGRPTPAVRGCTTVLWWIPR